jgi:hypothetical protein
MTMLSSLRLRRHLSNLPLTLGPPSGSGGIFPRLSFVGSPLTARDSHGSILGAGWGLAPGHCYRGPASQSGNDRGAGFSLNAAVARPVRASITAVADIPTRR